ncbi:MAG: carboxypeptidase regulatory-like domain-containing protein, partial [Phycisphaerae bacterium]
IINTGADDYEPRITADGQTLFFVRGQSGQNADIYWSRRTPQGWSEPAPLTSVNSDHDDLGPEPSADGLTLFFYSDRPGGQGGYDLWLARRRSDGAPTFEKPVNLGPLANSEFNEYGPAMTPDGTALYFASNRPQPGDDDSTDPDAWPATLREDFYRRDYDLYRCPLTPRGPGQSQPLTALNTEFNEGAPALSPVGDFIYFSSDRPGGFGAYDLYRSRQLHGQHQPPEHLGTGINSDANELDPGLTHLGYALFFSSDRPSRRIDPQTPNPYNLYHSTSREVFTETQVREPDRINWAALWRQLRPNLIWALLALLPTLLLLLLLRNGRYGRLSLLTRCVLASLLAHLLLLFLFNFWEVSATLADTFRRRGELRVALVTAAGRTDIERQIRGRMIDLQTPQVERVTAARPDTRPPLNQPVVPARFDVLDQPRTIKLVSALDLPTHDAPAKPVNLHEPPRPDDPATAPPPGLSMPQSQPQPDPTEPAPRPPQPRSSSPPRDFSSVPAVHAADAAPVPIKVAHQPVEFDRQPVVQANVQEASPPAQRRTQPTSPAPRPDLTLAALVELPADPTNPASEATPQTPEAPAPSRLRAPPALVQDAQAPPSPTHLAVTTAPRPLHLEMPIDSAVAAVRDATAFPVDVSAMSPQSMIVPQLPQSRIDLGPLDERAPPSAAEADPTHPAAVTGRHPARSAPSSLQPDRMRPPTQVALNVQDTDPAQLLAKITDLVDTPDPVPVSYRVTHTHVNLPEPMPLDLPELSSSSPTRPPDAIGTIRGRVVDAATGQGLEGAAVRLDLPDRSPVTVATDAQGQYVLFPPEVPEFFALSAMGTGYAPQSVNVANSAVRGTTLHLDFRLSPTHETVVVIEAVPEVHHLGDDQYDGRINSQFQKRAESAVFTAHFELSPDQLRPGYSAAVVSMLAKGVQTGHRLVINKRVLRKRLDRAPRDGSFGVFAAPFSASLLRPGTNTFQIRASSLGDDVDDFEFVNIRIRLVR